MLKRFLVVAVVAGTLASAAAQPASASSGGVWRAMGNVTIGDSNTRGGGTLMLIIGTRKAPRMQTFTFQSMTRFYPPDPCVVPTFLGLGTMTTSSRAPGGAPPETDHFRTVAFCAGKTLELYGLSIRPGHVEAFAGYFLLMGMGPTFGINGVAMDPCVEPSPEQLALVPGLRLAPGSAERRALAMALLRPRRSVLASRAA